MKHKKLILKLEDAVWRMNWATIKWFRLNKGFQRLTKKNKDTFANYACYNGKIIAYLIVLDELGDIEFTSWIKELRGWEWLDKQAGQLRETNMWKLAGLKEPICKKKK